jgi:hypothetical protein
MNCGPATKRGYLNSEEENVSKNAKIRASVAQSLRKIAQNALNVAPLGEKVAGQGSKIVKAADALIEAAMEIEKNG